MAISNTSILIKRSLTTGRPSTLNQGEFAYSYASNTLFIGTPGGNGVVNVGGQYYTSTLDAATSSNTATTLVKRDSNGAFLGRLYGLSNTAVVLNTARNFSVSGGDITASAQSFDGSADVTLSASLNSIPGLSAGTYGSSSAIPVVTVAANGRVTSVSTSSISSSFTVAGNSGSGTQNNGGTLTISGAAGSGITTAVTGSGNETVTLSTDTTLLRSNTTGARQVINTDLTISGNLTVQGNTTTVRVNDYIVDDPMIYLAGNNYSSDIVNIGFAANYFDGTWEKHTGFFRDSTDKRYYLFDNYIPELSGNNQIDKANTSFRVATLTANLTTSTITSSNVTNSTITGGTISGLSSDLAVADGGTGASTFNVGQIVIGNGTGALQQIANVTTAVTGALGTGKTITSITTDEWGRLTAYTGSDISGLTVTQGGTGVSTFSSGQLIVGNGTGALQALANTGTAGTYGSASVVPVITTDAWGRVSGVTATSIAIDASAITTGTLGVSRGGTGLSTATTNGIIFGNGTGAFGVTALAGSGSDQTWSNQILTVTNAGIPIWASAMDGGTF
jgi:hypothetical protein